MPKFTDDLFLGSAVTYQGVVPASALGNSSPMETGVGPLGRIYIHDVVPLTLNLVALATAAVYTAAITMVAGTGTTSVIRPDGVTVTQLDTPRALCVRTGAGSPTARAVTITGYDYYGQPMSEVITSSASASTTVNGKKAFWQVATMTIAASPVVTVQVGTTDIIGVPLAVSNLGYVARCGWDSTLAENTGTFTAAVATSPATTTTGDVRGTLALSSAADGVKRLVVGILLPSNAAGPAATRLGALGVTQV